MEQELRMFSGRPDSEDVDLSPLLAAMTAWAGEILKADERRRYQCFFEAPPGSALETYFSAAPWCVVRPAGSGNLPTLAVSVVSRDEPGAPEEPVPEASGAEARLLVWAGRLAADPPGQEGLWSAIEGLEGGGHLSARLFIGEHGEGAVLAVLLRRGDGTGLVVDPEVFRVIDRLQAFVQVGNLARTEKLADCARRGLAMNAALLGELRRAQDGIFIERHSLRRIVRNVSAELMVHRLRGVPRRHDAERWHHYADQAEQLQRELTAAVPATEGKLLWNRLGIGGKRWRVGFYCAHAHVFGGLEQWMCDLAAHLKEVGHIPFLIVRDPLPDGGGHLAERFPAPVRSLEGHPEDLDRTVGRHHLDVVVVNHVYEGLDQLRAGPMVVEVLHNIYFWQQGKEFFAHARRRVEGYIAPSPTVQAYSLDYLKLPVGSVCLIPHRLNPRGLCRPYRAYLERRFRSREFIIAAVGNIYPQKNFLCLVRAFARFARSHPEARLRIIGDAADLGFHKVITDAIREERLGDRVELAGTLSRGQVSRALADANLFVLPSLYEGFGLAGLEARYFGLPLLLSNTGHAPALVRQGIDGAVVEIAVPFEDLSTDTVEALSYAPPESSITALHEGLSRLAGDYPAVLEAAFETMGCADLFDFDLQAEAYLDRFRQGFPETGGSLGKSAAC